MTVSELDFIDDIMYDELNGIHMSHYAILNAFSNIKQKVEQKYPHIIFNIVNTDPYNICYSVDDKNNNSWCLHSTTAFDLIKFLTNVHIRKEIKNAKKRLCEQ